MKLVKTARRRRAQRHAQARRSTKTATVKRVTIAKTTPIDAALDAVLVRRGWALTERSPAGDVYDWMDSAVAADHETTYMIVAADDGADSDSLPPYRVRLADGQRLTYDTAACLVAELDGIEAYRY